MKKIKYKDIKQILEKNSLEVYSKISEQEIFSNIKTISNSSNNDLSFFSNSKYINDLKKIKAKACLIEKKFINYLPNNCNPIIVKDPYLALALLSNLFNDEILKSNGIISNNTAIDTNSKIEKNVQINPFTIILQNTEIKDGTYIGSNSSIGPNVIINKNVVIHDNVSISNAIIMDNCIIKSGARIGGTGFGFEMKTKQKINHSGNVVIGKNTSIGSNTTIDRAVFDSTSIGEFSNIDNLVQIAHNVNIGDFAIIAAQVGIAGSSKIGNYVKIGGQAGISGHLIIGDNVTIAGKSGVTKNITNNAIIAGFPAKDIKLWKKEIIRNSLRK
ncbi:UDP-3-O-(3-hydroxymyristoyl)glucosamine N-acyltransferase [Pelagibacteraceae bacterium]|nr:UDP-3-O-(3-hydroxymyristoyl)glucosamine N-acyltransferase [Pelagibacteraceae bacterium]